MNALAMRFFKEAAFWPSPEQDLLLTAALDKGQQARRAWLTWVNRCPFDSIDEGSRRLAPLLYRNLIDLGVDHPLMGRLKGLYRQSWYENQILLRPLPALLRNLSAINVPTLLFKGVPLVESVYKDLALRPMRDLDILIPRSASDVAFALLDAEGWRRKTPASFAPQTLHAITFSSPDGIELDLHFSPFHEIVDPELIEPLWHDAEPYRYREEPTSVLCSSDQMLVVLAHGARNNPVPPLRWIADATLLLRSGPPIDWSKLCDRAEALRLSLVVRETLGYLARRGEQVPDHVLSRLSGQRVTVNELLECRARTSQREKVIAAAHHWGLYTRTQEESGLVALLLGFPKYLRQVWGVTTWVGFFQAARSKLHWRSTRSTADVHTGSSVS